MGFMDAVAPPSREEEEEEEDDESDEDEAAAAPTWMALSEGEEEERTGGEAAPRRCCHHSLILASAAEGKEERKRGVAEKVVAVRTTGGGMLLVPRRPRRASSTPEITLTLLVDVEAGEDGKEGRQVREEGEHGDGEEELRLGHWVAVGVVVAADFDWEGGWEGLREEAGVRAKPSSRRVVHSWPSFSWPRMTRGAALTPRGRICVQPRSRTRGRILRRAGAALRRA
jgi:hypothetical protein